MTHTTFGVLHEYRCHIGHRFSLKTLISEKRNSVEDSLDSALAQSEELTALLKLAAAETSEPDEQTELRDELERRNCEQETLRALVGMRKSSRTEP